MPRSKYTAEEKYNILSKYQKGILSSSQISTKYNIHRSRSMSGKDFLTPTALKDYKNLKLI